MMSWKRRNVWVFAVCLVTLAALCLPASAGDDETPATLVGTVVEADWDEDDNVIAVDLETDDGTYQIELTGSGARLLSHVGEQVEVEGTVFEDEDGWWHVRVSAFRVLTSGW